MKYWCAVAAVVGLVCPALTVACGGTFLEAKGTIRSPRYPLRYPHNKECIYRILASEDARIKLSCFRINLQHSRGCQNDSLSINGIYKCGNSKLVNVFGQGAITIRFTSDGSVSRRGGFRCTYERVSGGEYVETDGTLPENICGNTPATTRLPATTLTPTTTPKTPATTAPMTAPPLTTTTPATTTSCTSDDTDYDYDEVLHKSLLFYEAQRSGFLPASQRVTWRRDSATDDAIDPDTNQRVDLEGGYYDAGDYGKFGYPMASATTVLAWGAVEHAEAYQAAGEMANMRAAVKWATDYFLKAHVAPNVFYGQVGNGEIGNNYWGRPEDMNMYRPAYKITESKPGSDLAGETAAALAAASILFKDSDSSYSDSCLLHARQLYSFANNFRGKYSDSIPDAANFYYSWGVYDDELAWAALWLYRATGEETFLTQAKAHYSNVYISGVQEFSWAEKTPGAMVLLAQLTDASEKQTYLQHLESFCDRTINDKLRTPKGLVFIGKWGSLRYAANVAFVCLRAADLGIKSEEYRAFGKQQIHYMLGSTGRSFVVGFGNNPPQQPHHASSSCKDPPAPCSWPDFHSPYPNPHILYGALVGGPGQDDSYADVRSDYIKNEVACDYNAGFQSAVAALRHLAQCSGSTSTTASPDTTTTALVTTRLPGNTTQPPTKPGPQPTTDGEGSSSCDLVEQTNEWLGNFQANLIIQVPVTVKSWTVTLTFSSVVTQFRVWVAIPSSAPSKTITLTNKSYNGWQTAGNTLTINFIAGYSGAKPEVTSLTFNDVSLCSKGTIVGPATPTDTTTRGGGSSSCDISSMVQQTHEWLGNFQANLVVKIPFSTQSWSIKLTFSSAVSQFQVWVADAIPTSSTTVTLTNKSYNGMQTVGNTLTINFIASYVGTKPQVTSITFNDSLLCLY